MNASALILLSTYNGENYLAEQLDSLIAQTFENWVLLVRDDGSSDATIEMVKQYSALDKRIIFIADHLGNLKPAKSFSALMELAVNREEEFIFFCDQDDVWLPNKLLFQIGFLRDRERRHGTDLPVLVHSDLCVVNSSLKLIHPSFLRYEKLQRNSHYPLNTLLINNFVTGCTIGMNRKLLQLTTPIPNNAFMHDWWCALCAATQGKIEFINSATVLYRQHGKNSIGSGGFYGKFKTVFSFNHGILKRIKNLKLCFAQAQDLLTRMSAENQHFALVTTFNNLPTKRFFFRYLSGINLQLSPAGKTRALVFWIFLLFV